MNVAKQMVLGLDSALYSTQQLHTAGPDPRTAQVPVSNRWCVGDEDVRVFRNRLPLLQALSSPWYIERPIAKLWLPVDEEVLRVQEYKGGYKNYFLLSSPSINLSLSND